MGGRGKEGRESAAVSVRAWEIAVRRLCGATFVVHMSEGEQSSLH